MSFLELQSLRKTWPDGTQAVKSLDLAIEAGQFVVLLGPSGCGKTTTLRMVAGLEQPSSGSVRLNSQDVTHAPPSARDIGFVFQFHALYPHMSVEQNLLFPLENVGVPKAERRATVARVAAALGLDGMLRRRPRELSGGDQQRVALGRALVRKPALWLMDEPLGMLDAGERAHMCEFLRAKQLEHRAATMYVTHDQEEAMRLADRVVVMDRGEVLQDGPPGMVYSEPQSLFVARFVGSPGMNLIEGDARAGVFQARGTNIQWALPHPVPDGPVIVGARPENVRVDAEGAFTGRVVLDAFVGPCRYVHLDSPAGRIVVRVSADQSAPSGGQWRVEFDPRALCLFDPRTGRRLNESRS